MPPNNNAGKSKSDKPAKSKPKRIRKAPTDQQSIRFDRIKKLVKEGKSIAQIAPELGLSKARVGQIIANMRRRGMMVKSKAKAGRRPFKTTE